MTRPASRHPTELELEILKILWREGPMPVRGVRQALAPSRKLAYTSVMTVMGIMAQKGYLRRSKHGTHFVYQPAITKQSTVRGIVRDVVDRVFDGSAAAAALHLVETADLDERELRAIRRILEQKGEDKP
ncbi:MAG: BlaI/MecI/CopY family transcriptional regulator [Candidatus Hydrogenedentes bacterium]|nr:BlaI/MecI/CopY family transcriptional regulator [Candidatus Hydrogenedentota bacterium]